MSYYLFWRKVNLRSLLAPRDRTAIREFDVAKNPQRYRSPFEAWAASFFREWNTH